MAFTEDSLPGMLFIPSTLTAGTTSSAEERGTLGSRFGIRRRRDNLLAVGGRILERRRGRRAADTGRAFIGHGQREVGSGTGIVGPCVWESGRPPLPAIGPLIL